jgi:hypothetical protein
VVWRPDYCTSVELKRELKITDDLDDAWVALVVTAASRAVDRHARRQFGLLAAAEPRQCGPATYRIELDRWVVPIPDLMTDVGLIVELGDDTLTDAELEPLDAPDDGKPWTRLALAEASSVTWPTRGRRVTVTAQWGWSAVPSTVKTATLLQAQRFYARRDSPYGVAGSPDLGSELRLLAKVDADVAVMLTDYVRLGGPR